MRRVLALLAAAVLAAVALTGCVRNLPNPARDWLAGQDGVAAAEVLSDNTGAWSSSGLVRGELKPGITDDQIATLVGKVQEYSAKSGGVAFWLGLEDIDFGVAAGDNAGAVGLWRSLVSTDGVLSGVVYDGDVRARTLRSDAAGTLDSLLALNASLSLEAFADAAAADADRDADIQYAQINKQAVEFDRAAGCEPDPAVLEFARTLVDRDDVPGATADLCKGITIDLPATASLADQAIALRSEIDDRGLSEFSVQLDATQEEGLTRFAAISPGDADVLPVLKAFEGDGVPDLSYSLGSDSNIAVTGFSVPTGDLVALMQSSPAASKLVGIGLEGDPVSIAGTLKQLPRLLDDAIALSKASDAFGSVTLGQGFGNVTLAAEGTNQPDVEKAAADLRASGATERRFFSVYYAAFEADIVNGVAALTEPDYVGADVMQAFVDAWNAGAH